MSFLPEGYIEKDPVGNYLKLQEGDNSIRVLSNAIVGWEIWGDKIKDGKTVRVPYRFREGDDIEPKYQEMETDSNRFKKFWAFVVWSRENKKVQILEITQAGVRKAINALILNKKWGDPKEYDIIITKNKVGALPMDVEYIVTPDPKEVVDKEITTKYEAMNINLQALYDGKDPFKSEEVNVDDVPEFLESK